MVALLILNMKAMQPCSSTTLIQAEQWSKSLTNGHPSNADKRVKRLEQRKKIRLLKQ